jgi:CRISPR-associated protein Csx14
VATLGHEPQVVTVALDALLHQGRALSELLVVHTSAPAVLEGLRAIRREFASGRYPTVRLRSVPVKGETGKLEDFRTEEDVRALLSTLYRAVREAKRHHGVVHVCLAGGRKVMSVAAMVVAQLLFGPEDRVWHLLSEGWTPAAPRRMHLAPGEEAHLVPVPVLRWDDPGEAIRRYQEIVRGERMRRRREFVERWLTQAEREVAQLACAGLDNAAIARRLHRSPRTVANQLTAVYAKLQEWLGFPGPPVSRPLLLSELAPYFELVEASKSRVGSVSQSGREHSLMRLGRGSG